MISTQSSGSLKKTTDFLQGLKSGRIFDGLDRFGRLGVEALANATPRESGETANSWFYQVVRKPGQVVVEWHNTHIVDGAPIAILIQYGHGTGTGGYVQGRDYINPAIRPIFDQIAQDVWEKVKS